MEYVSYHVRWPGLYKHCCLKIMFGCPVYKTDVVLNAIIRKTQVRLIEANKKTNQLAMEISDLLSSIKSKGDGQNELAQRIANLRTKITEINKSNND